MRLTSSRAEFALQAGDAVRDIGLHGAQGLRPRWRNFRGRRCQSGPLIGGSPCIKYTDRRLSHCIHLKDTNRDGILVEACVTDYPPIGEPRVLQKDQPPPGWSFCVFWASSVCQWFQRPIPARCSSRQRAVRTVNCRLANDLRRLGHRDRRDEWAWPSPRDLLEALAATRTVILVSGTNGKTTTTAMIAAGWGGRVATNETGSNMPAGHVAALAASKS